jgi:ParB-like chromosome segregation protein Spo0J
VSRRLGKAGGALAAPVVRLDDNVGTYDVRRDGRSGEGRLQSVRLDRIDASPFQVRRVFAESDVEKLADSIMETGLIHEPRGRPHPSKPGWVELMPGEMRIRALRRLVERGEAEGLLERDGEGNWLVSVRVDETDDERAESIVLAENQDRTDLSAWEWALAWRQRQDSLARRGLPASVRDVAGRSNQKFQTLAEYLAVARAVTPAVLAEAGVTRGAEPDHQRMARLPLAALKRVAQAAGQGGTNAAAAARVLLLELRRAGDAEAAAHLERAKRMPAATVAEGGFQLNIRVPLDRLTPRQATHYLAKITPALDRLAARAAEADPAEVEALAGQLERALGRLRAAR